MSLAGVRYAHASSHTSKGKQTTSLNLRTRINAIDHLSGELFLAWQLTGVGPPAARGNRKVGDCQPSTSKLSAVSCQCQLHGSEKAKRTSPLRPARPTEKYRAIPYFFGISRVGSQFSRTSC